MNMNKDIFPRPDEALGEWLERVNPRVARYESALTDAKEQEAFGRGYRLATWTTMHEMFDMLAEFENDGLAAWLVQMAGLIALSRRASARDFRSALKRHMKSPDER